MSNPAVDSGIRVGRYLDKSWDWDAFPANAGYPELERAQMRYVGAGGSPKSDDRSTLPPGAFTCSLIFQEPGRKASTHHHKIEELFFVHRGRLTMSWQFGDEVVDFIVGPGDAVLNPTSRPHGFRNDGTEDCVMQIMVATAAPMNPTYTDHPAEHAVSPLRPAAPEKRAEYMREVERYLARASAVAPHAAEVEGGTFSASPYVMAAAAGGLVTPTHFTYAVDTLTRGAATPPYALAYEEALMVLDGALDVETIDAAGHASSLRLGARDLAWIPAGVSRRLRNRDAATVRFGSIAGSKDAVPIAWQHALAAH
ncbi:MAG TPA: cupin domain-containing protein [Candidatus Lustribacter sp.]|nr:cupin domain-containing protein [Candidatus Lustribacter sp.]